MKRIIILFIACLLFFPFLVKAENLEIVDMDNIMDNDSNGILYSNGKLLLDSKYAEENRTIYNNIKKFSVLNNKLVAYINDDNEFFDSFNLHQNVIDFFIVKNQKYGDDIFLIDSNNDLFGICPDNQYRCGNLTSKEGKLIGSQVKKAKAIYDGTAITVLYLTYNNDLYVVGQNYFGTKINSGNPIEEPIKLLENINFFSYMYAVDMDGNFYIFSDNNPRPTIYSKNVKKVIEDEMDSYFIGNTVNRFVVQKEDNSFELWDYDYKWQSKNINLNVKKIINHYILTNDGELYYYNNENHLIDENVVDINLFNNQLEFDGQEKFYVYLNNKNELYYVDGTSFYYFNDYRIESKLIKKMYGSDYLSNRILFLKNVKSIKYANNNFIILNDNTILSMNTNSSSMLNQINDLINNNKEIKAKQIYLSFKGIYDYTIKDEFDAYATVIPYNATNKELVWESSNTDVADVNSEGYIVTKGVGSTTISVKTKDGSVSESHIINVYPEPNKIEITNGNNITIGKNEKILLNAKITPDDTLKKDIIWEELDSNEDTYLYKYDYENDKEYDDNQRIFRCYKGGTYRIKVSTYDKKYSDIITINVVEKTSYIELDIPKSNYDGYNAFVFLFENNSFKANATAMPESANNREITWSSSNTLVAEVTNDGVITGKKAGRAIITINAVDGGTSREFNVIVYDSNGYGESSDNVKITGNPKISVSKYNDNSIILNIIELENASNYEIYRSTNKTKNYKKITTTENNSYINTGLTYGTTYYYKVIAKNNVSKSGYSNIVSVKVLPNKVSNLKVDSVTSTNVKLSYDKVNTTGYEVYRSTNNKKWSKVTTITKNSTLSYNNTKLKANTTYYYKTRAYKKVGSKKIYGSYSDVVKVRTSPSSPKISLSNKEYDSLSLTINSVSGAVKYIVERSIDKKTYDVIKGLTKNGTLVDNELITGITYYYRVKVCNSEERCSSYSSVVSKKVVPKAPSLSLKTTSKKVNVTVSSVNGIDGYEIYRSTNSKKGFKLINTIEDLDNLTISNTTSKNKTYYYKVRSYKIIDNTKVYSNYSSVKKIKSK